MEHSESTILHERVRLAQQGDESALRELIVAYQRRIAGFVYTVVGRSDSVEDLAQQVFIKMVRSIGSLQSPSQFEAWLFRLSRNVCIDHLRRERLRRVFVPFSTEHSEVAEPVGAVDSEELDALRHALSRLRPADRALLALAEEGRTQAEMAEITGTSIVVVKARLYRARERLRKVYQPKTAVET